MLTPSTATSCDTCRKFVSHGTLQIFGRVTATVALAFTLIGFAPATTYAQAPQCTGFEAPLVTSFVSCQAEFVSVTGLMRQVFCFHSDASGGQHLTMRTLAHGQGTSPAVSKKYTFNGEQTYELETPSSGTREETLIQNLVLVRQAEDGTIPLFTDDDLFLRLRFHVTMPHGGMPTAQFGGVETVCH